MKSNQIVRNQRGATLVEAMIAIFILTFGILTVMVMQIRAIGASSTAMNRTEANNVSLALLETLKELPFDNANLTKTTATLAELTGVTNNQQLQLLIDAGKVRTFTAAAFPEMQTLVQAGTTAGMITDRTGITYQLAWAVVDQTLASGETLHKTLWVFLYWNSLMGQNRLQMTTVKYSNVPL